MKNRPMRGPRERRHQALQGGVEEWLQECLSPSEEGQHVPGCGRPGPRRNPEMDTPWISRRISSSRDCPLHKQLSNPCCRHPSGDCFELTQDDTDTPFKGHRLHPPPLLLKFPLSLLALRFIILQRWR